jgi:hypothetical protein
MAGQPDHLKPRVGSVLAARPLGLTCVLSRSRRPDVAALFRVHEGALRGSPPMARDQFAHPIAGGETEREDGD